jgi:hypothetical protein
VAATALRLAALATLPALAGAARRGSGRRGTAFGGALFLGFTALDPGFLEGIASLLT